MPDKEEKFKGRLNLLFVLGLVGGLIYFLMTVPALNQWRLQVYGSLTGVESQKQICDDLIEKHKTEKWVLPFLAQYLRENEKVNHGGRFVDHDFEEISLGEYVYLRLLEIADLPDFDYSFNLRSSLRVQRYEEIMAVLEAMETSGYFDASQGMWMVPEDLE